LREENIQESGRCSDKIREEKIPDASSSWDGRMRDPVILILEITAMLDKHEPDKTK
jgi:hypothetical protein